MIPIYKPHIPDSSVRYATDAVESTWISSIGKYIELATDKLRDLSGCEYVLLTNNGTSATHLVTRSLARFEPKTKIGEYGIGKMPFILMMKEVNK